MRLTRLSIDRLPGIAGGFEIKGLDSGLNLVLGPNASGKSSLCRAVRALLYGEAVDGPVSLEASFDDGRGSLNVVRQGKDIRWTRDGEPVDRPALPDERMVRCFTVQLEDLLSEGDTENAIRERIGKILAGGYDIDSVRATRPFCTPPQHGKKEEQALRAAESRLAKERTAQQGILEQERELDGLRQRKAEAARARERVVGLEIAIELLGERRKVARTGSDLSEFPEGMEALAGDEMERLERLRSDLARHEHELGQAGQIAEDARRRLADSRLEDSTLSESTLEEHGGTAESLRRAEREREEADTALRSAEESLAGAVRELGGSPSGNSTITPEIVGRVEAGLEEQKSLDSDERALGKQIGRLRVRDEDESTIDALRNARAALSRWLSSPKPESGGLRPFLPGFLVLDAIALPAIGIAAWYLNPWFALLALLLLLGNLLPIVTNRAPQDLREKARQDFAGTHVEEPASWTEEKIGERLAELDRRLADAERARSDGERREELERERETLGERREEIAGELRGLAEEVGFDPMVLNASFLRWVQLVREHDDARRKVLDLRGARETRAEQEKKLCDKLSIFLERHGESPEDGASGADAIAARIRRLGERLTQRDRALENLRTAERDADRARQAVRDATERTETLFRKAGLQPGDDLELARRLEQREAWAEKTADLRERSAVARDHDRRLGDREDLRTLVDGDDESALNTGLDEARALADAHEELSNRIKLIEAAIEGARSSNALEEARAHRSDCENALRTRLEEDLIATSADFLLNDVQRQYLDASRPEVLRRAEEWFGRFTRHAFALQSPTSREGEILAREASTEEKRGLAQLSSGTRMQLLLALRLAFALDAEQGCEALPFFLDEALTVADPDRCRSVVECLHAFARDENRQVFYLTAQPADVLEWTGREFKANCIRLDEIRRLANALPDLDSLELPEPETVSSCEGLTAVEYGALLEVPGVALWDPPGAVHLFHLLRDDLPFLERILNLGIRTAGQLRGVLASDTAAVLLTRNERKNLEWRLAVVDAFLPICREGRGRPVDRDALEAAGVSDRFIDGLTALVGEKKGDARALLAAIDSRDDARVKGFHTAQRNLLEASFEEHEHLDSRLPLEASEVEHRVLGAMTPYIEDRATTPERVISVTRGLAATVFPK